MSLGNPLRFNDPFDSFIAVDESNKKKSIKLLEEFFYIKKFNDLLESHELPSGKFASQEKRLAELRKEIVKTRQFLHDASLYKTALNTISEIVTKDYTYNEILEKEKADFIKNMTKKLMGFRESALVSCFCERYDSILMWGHYADRDRGVCIEYERPLDNPNFYKVRYQKKRIPFNLFKITTLVLGYLFTNDVIDESDDKLISSIIEPFLTKSYEWKYEDEIRCIFARSSKDENIYTINKPTRPDGIQYLYHMPTKVTRIFLGCKISSEREQNIKRLADELGIPVVKMKPDNYIYRLDPVEIK